MGYKITDNYCEQARKYQSIPSEEEARTILEASGYNMNINNEIHNTKDEKEDKYMAILAAPSHTLPVVSKEKSHEFIKKSNEKRITPQRLAECKKSSSLFKKNFKDWLCIVLQIGLILKFKY